MLTKVMWKNSTDTDRFTSSIMGHNYKITRVSHCRQLCLKFAQKRLQNKWPLQKKPSFYHKDKKNIKESDEIELFNLSGHK